MNDAQQIIMQVGHKLAGTDFANAEQPKHTPLVIAGTSNGLLFLNSEQYVELEGYSITDVAFSQEGLWAIANRNSVWHRNLNGEWHQVVLMNDLQLNCILPIEGAILAGTSGACLLQIADGSTTRINCFESVEGREEWYTPWGAPPDCAINSRGSIW